MIDFRYHLVSLVSVFMALAIGVVLGAGPLKGAIGDTLSSQVEELRRDTTDLQRAVANREEQIADRDAFVDAVTPQLLTGQLVDQAVLLVTLPGADAAAADALVERVEAAGATITGRVAVQPRWTDPEQEELRGTLLDDVAPLAGPDPETDPGDALAQALARATLRADLVVPGTPGTDRAAILDALAAGELITVDGDATLPATLALVLTGTPDDEAGAGVAEWQDAAAQSYGALVSQLDRAASGAVVTGPVSSAAAEAGLLSRLRGVDEVTGRASTVDGVDTPVGRASVVLALREQLTGSAGQYGVADNADALLAPVTPPEPSPAASAGGG